MRDLSQHIKPPQERTQGAQERDEANEARQRLQELAKRSNEAQALRRREESLQWCGLGKRFLEATFDSYEVITPEQQRVLDVCRRFGTNFSAALEKGSNLVLLGNTGTGKTMLAAAILTSIIRAGYTGRYYTVHGLIRTIRDTWDKASPITERELMKQLINYDLLVLDEVGVQFGSEAEKVNIFELINGRYERMKPTIAISNLTLRTDESQQATIDDALGDRVVDRLKHNSVVIPFGWESWRVKRAGK